MSYCTTGASASHGVHGECETTFTTGRTTIVVAAVPGGGTDPEVRGVITAKTRAEFDAAVALLATVQGQVAAWRAETHRAAPAAVTDR